MEPNVGVRLLLLKLILLAMNAMSLIVWLAMLQTNVHNAFRVLRLREMELANVLQALLSTTLVVLLAM